MRAALRAHARLLPPHAVRPYVRRNKTDRTDTKGMLEAFRNEEIHPVPVKSVAQQTLAALHRLHSVWLAERTARINTPRALLREFGILIPLGARHAVPCAWAQLEDADSDIPDALRPSLAELCSEIRDLERRIRMIERQLAALATQTPAVAQLLTLPGIGLLIVTALIAFVGDIHRFPSARHFASYLGLTPTESSSGLRRRLGAISKRGDVYLRTLLIHGARSVLNAAKRRKTLDLGVSMIDQARVAWRHGPTVAAPILVRRTPGISCEALPAPDWPERGQGGTSACRTGPP